MKRSLIRLVVAIASFLAALVELALRIVQFAILLVERVTQKLEVGARRLAVEGPKVPVLVAAPVEEVPVAPDAEQRLVGALSGKSLGFPVRSARAFAATVRGRLVTEPMDALVREGIARLSAS